MTITYFSSEPGEVTGDLPSVKLLDEDLFVRLGSGRDGYSAALLAEYGTPDERVQQEDFDWGVLVTISRPVGNGRRAAVTHLVFGGCFEAQAREYLVSVGLGGAPIITVYGPDAVIPSDDEPVDEL